MSSTRASGAIASLNVCDRRCDPLAGRVLVEEDAVAGGLGAEDDVLGHGHHGDEHEVLVHHPDPEVDRVLRRVDLGSACP